MSAGKRKRRRARITPAAPVVPSAAPAVLSGTAGRPRHWVIAGLACLALSGLIAAGVGSSTVVGDGIAAAACWMTGCFDGALALIGWVMTMSTVVLALVAWFVFPRCGIRGRIVFLVSGTVACTLVFLLAPDPRDRMNGDGSWLLGNGMVWGFGTLVVGAVLTGIALLLNRVIAGSGAAIAFFAGIPTLVLGAVFTYIDNHNDDADAVIMTTHIFPEVTMRIAGDDLTRVSASDWQGCGDRFKGCGHTAEFEYTTTDSDAVTHLEIIWFSSAVDAWDAEETVSHADDGTFLRMSSVMHEHLLISTVKHADGRRIADADESWLRWPTAQLTHEFRSRFDFKAVESLKAGPTAAPRTP